MNSDTLKKFEVLKEELRMRYGEWCAEEKCDHIKDALKEKKYRGQTIYKIDIYTIEKRTLESDEEDAKIHFVPTSWHWREIEDVERYPFSPLSLSKSIYTLKFHSIEPLINKEISRKNADEMIQYIFVTQFPCDKSSTVVEKYAHFPPYNYISMHSFDYKGHLVDSTVTSSPGFGKLSNYYGRQKDQIRFNEGDIVEVADLYFGQPGMKIGRVKKAPLDIIDKCVGFKERNQYLEDSYEIGVIEPELSCLKRMSVPAINVFYPRFPIAKEVLDKLNKSEIGFI